MYKHTSIPGLAKSLLTLTLFLSAPLFAKEITPLSTIETSGLVSDFAEDKGYLYVATDAGIVDIIDLSSEKTIRKIVFPPIHTAMGDTVPSRIHSIDRFEGQLLMVTSASNAYRNVWLYDGNTLRKVIDASQKIMPKHAYFVSKDSFIFGSFGSDITLYDNNEKSKLYVQHISESTMGGMALSRDKKTMAVSDESGTVRLIELNSSKVLQNFDSEHVDNIYQVAYANGTVISAGQDRRIGVYPKNGKAYHIKSDFLVYAVGLSPSGKTGIYSSGINHDLQIFTVSNGKKGDTLVGHYATPNKIYFINEEFIISSGDENKIFFWKLKK